MIYKTIVGTFKLTVNKNNCFNKEKFLDFYIKEIFDKHNYIIGDFSQESLRLKGFSNNKNPLNFQKKIHRYLKKFCSPDCSYFLLEIIK